MPQYTDEELEELFETDPSANSPLVKHLRDKLKANAKAAKEAEERASKAEKAVRQRTVADVLKEKGANPGLARYVLADVDDPTPESVSSWLSENGEIFGFKPPAPDPKDAASVLGLPAGTELPPDLLVAYEKFLNGQQGGQRPVGGEDAQIAAIKSAGSAEELLALLTSGG